ncbi:MAG: DUF917 domain-containing protein [Weeksellaceae bacterium]
MNTTITQDIATDIIAGASIFSTGGGFEYTAQLKKLPEIFAADSTLRLISVDELADTDYICTAYGVGSASNTDVDLSAALTKGFAVMQEITGKTFAGIFAGETNIEALVFETAKSANLPIIDADCTGGRAVPEIQFDNLFVAGRNILPLVAVTLKGDVAVLYETDDPVFIERFVRNIAVSTGESVAVIDHPMSVADAKQYLTLGIFERSRQMGAIINNAAITVDAKIAKIIKQTQASVLLQGLVSEIDLSSEKGFLEGTITVADGDQNAVLHVKNETLVCTIDSTVRLTAPDLITVLDLETGFGVHNSKIAVGQQVCIIGISASKLWRTDAGVKRFNPQAVGLAFETVLL